jgi:hypothetical protein
MKINKNNLSKIIFLILNFKTIQIIIK